MCFLLTLMLLGPRFATLIWWFVRPAYYQTYIDSWFWAVLGIIFAPWTMLMYLLIAPGGIIGFDWVWLGLAAAIDIASYTTGYYKRQDIPLYPKE